MKDKNHFKFSIIIAVYNVSPFLKEAVESIIHQNIGFENVQVILVDDGSTDDSGMICDSYQNIYPDNVIVCHKQNGGVSSARNEGLKYAAGEYVNFLDGDDKLSPETLKNVYDYFKKWESETDIITIPLRFFDGEKGEHILNNKFLKGSRVVDLNEEYNLPLLSLSASFIKRCIAVSHFFDERLTVAEDAKYVLQILCHNMHYGVVKEAVYWYRRRVSGQPSAIQKAQRTEAWYKNCIQHFALWAIKDCKSRLQQIPAFVQFTLMYELQWRFLLVKHYPHDLLKDYRLEDYKADLRQVLQYIDDSIILEQYQLPIEHKLFALRLKHGMFPKIERKADDVFYHYDSNVIYCLSELPMSLDFITISGHSLTMEGRIMVIREGQNVQETIINLRLNDSFFKCEIQGKKVGEYSLDEPISDDIGFKITVPIEENKAYCMKFFCKSGGTLIEKKTVQFGKFAPIQNQMHTSYFTVAKHVLTYQNNTLYLSPCTLKKHFCHEIAYLKEILSKRDKAAIKAFIMRNLVHMRRAFPKKEVWLISDRIEQADDNGEALYRYLAKRKDKKIQAIFAISPECRDFVRLQQYGRVIPLSGWRYKWYYLCGAKVVSSQAEDFVSYPLLDYSFYYSDLIQKSHFVFLQHGITKDDLSGYSNKYEKNIKLFVTVTRAEWESILQYPYFYSEKEVKLVGFPRYDLLYHDEKKYITIMPSWRAYLVGAIDIHTGRRAVCSGFKNSLYFDMYCKLLSDKRLISTAREYGFQIRFLNHPNMKEAIGEMDMDSSVEVLSNETEPYRKIFAETNLLITDYSSVAFDFAYLRKPVLYYQADSEEFFSGKHTYDKGYFDYERDGFGEVEYTADAMVNRIIEYMKQDCRLKDEYRKRIEQTFPFHDNCNCQRVYEAIRQI